VQRLLMTFQSWNAGDGRLSTQLDPSPFAHGTPRSRPSKTITAARLTALLIARSDLTFDPATAPGGRIERLHAPHVCPTDESPDPPWASGQCAYRAAASVLPQLVRRTPTAPTSIRG
jgi:hypothetical protein